MKTNKTEKQKKKSQGTSTRKTHRCKEIHSSHTTEIPQKHKRGNYNIYTKGSLGLKKIPAEHYEIKNL